MSFSYELSVVLEYLTLKYRPIGVHNNINYVYKLQADYLFASTLSVISALRSSSNLIKYYLKLQQI